MAKRATFSGGRHFKKRLYLNLALLFSAGEVSPRCLPSTAHGRILLWLCPPTRSRSCHVSPQSSGGQDLGEDLLPHGMSCDSTAQLSTSTSRAWLPGLLSRSGESSKPLLSESDAYAERALSRGAQKFQF